MKEIKLKKSFFSLIIICFVLVYVPLLFAESSTRLEENGEKKLLQRIDFGNSYIVGQTIKSGAVYLLQRKKSEIKSMLHYRKDYRKEILEAFKIKDDRIKDDKAKN